MRIGKHPIGPEHQPYVIAEIGSNHGGDLREAIEYIKRAAWCGADAAKFQLFHPERLYPGQWTPGAIDEAWLPELDAACKASSVDFLCSVFDRDTLNAYLEVDPVAVKIASAESHDLALLDEVGATNRPVLVATGASTWSDVDKIAVTLADDDLVLLHCTSAYPAPDVEANVFVVRQLADDFLVPVGLSDHTLHGPAPALAVALGACVIEKHLTFNRTLPGPDHGFALEPGEFRQMVGDVRRVRALLGDGVKRVTASEDPTDRRVAA